MGPCATGDVVCDIRHKEVQVASLTTTAVPQSHDLGGFQGHRKQPENSSAMRMQGRVEKGCFGRARSELRERELFGGCREQVFGACCKVWMYAFGLNLSPAVVTWPVANLARQAARGCLHCSPIVHSRPVSDSCFLVSISLLQIDSSLAHPSDF